MSGVNDRIATIGAVRTMVTHSPWRTTRRTIRGWRAPTACAANAAVAMVTPKQNIQARKNVIELSEAPASASAPSLPIIAVSVVIIATQASWVRMMGIARRNVMESSMRQSGPSPELVAASCEISCNIASLGSLMPYPELKKTNRRFALCAVPLSTADGYRGRSPITGILGETIRDGRRTRVETLALIVIIVRRIYGRLRCNERCNSYRVA